MKIVVANPTLGPHRAVIDEVSLPDFAPKGWLNAGTWSGHGTLTSAEWAASTAPPRPKKKSARSTPTGKEK